MTETPQRNYVWIYILTGILTVLGILGLIRGDWVGGGYLLGAIGLIVWIHGTKRGRMQTVRLGLILAGAGVVILLIDMVRDIFA